VTLLRDLAASRWLRYGLTLLLVLLVVLKVRPQHLAAAAASARPEYLALALPLTIPFLYLKALRWLAMLRAGGVSATFGEALYSLLGGMGLALLTPARLGELVRVAYLRDRQKWKIGGLVMIDKGFDVLVLCGLAVPGAWLLLGPLAGVAFLAITAVGLLVIYNPRHLSRLLHRLSAPFPFRTRLEQAWSSLESLSPVSATIFLALTLVIFAVVLLQFAVILLSWRSWSLDVILLTFPLVILTNILPLTVGGLGVREGVAALLLAHYAVSPSDAALTAFLSFTLNTALPGLVGVFLLPSVSPRPTALPSAE
jgi:uncharacterized membrane protein YbhN (UPF0104 family)